MGVLCVKKKKKTLTYKFTDVDKIYMSASVHSLLERNPDPKLV